MNLRDITKATLDLDLSASSGVESVFYGEIEPSRVELVLKEPDVFLKASGVKVPENAEIQVSALTRDRLKQSGGAVPARRVVVVVIIFGPIVIVIVVF
ncbi:hypothetical protein C7B76_18245 [filamentous cyanobacterium CCP2]|nr:hypothetical protein C7B76_18245 [filamentous cyanobacterium CCP2]